MEPIPSPYMEQMNPDFGKAIHEVCKQFGYKWFFIAYQKYENEEEEAWGSVGNYMSDILSDALRDAADLIDEQGKKGFPPNQVS